STTSYSAASRTISVRSLSSSTSRARVTSGVASIGDGSLIASPTRTDPTSIPRRLPVPGSPSPGWSGSRTVNCPRTVDRRRPARARHPAHLVAYSRRLRDGGPEHADRPVDPRRVGSAALSHVGLASSPTGDGARELRNESARGEALVLGSGGRGDDETHLPRRL